MGPPFISKGTTRVGKGPVPTRAERGDTLELPLMAEFETNSIRPKDKDAAVGQHSLFDDLAKNDEAAN
jgi:hypothetical protein